MNIADIIASLDSRSESELIQIQSYVTKLLEKHIDIDKDLFYFILEELGQDPITIDRFARGSFGSRWKKGQKAFNEIMSQLTADGHYKRIQLVAIKRFLASILLDHLREQKRPINIETVCFALCIFSEIFERAFPGYRKNHLGSLIMTKLSGD